MKGNPFNIFKLYMFGIHIQTHTPHFKYADTLIRSLIEKTNIRESNVPIFVILDDKESVTLFEKTYKYTYDSIQYLNVKHIINTFNGDISEKFTDLFKNVIDVSWGGGEHRNYVAVKRTYSILELRNRGYSHVWCLDSESQVLKDFKIEDIVKHNISKPLLVVGKSGSNCVKYPQVLEKVLKQDFNDFNDISIRMNDFWFIHTEVFNDMIKYMFNIHDHPISYFMNGSEQSLYEYYVYSLYIRDRRCVELVQLNGNLHENTMFRNMINNRYLSMNKFCDNLNEVYFNKVLSFRGDYILECQETRRGQQLVSMLNIRIAVSNYLGT
tara:strand:+ start:3464 stop:4438 length:975 start_codon:yes stop_codon:yes gene_type:complete